MEHSDLATRLTRLGDHLDEERRLRRSATGSTAPAVGRHRPGGVLIALVALVALVGAGLLLANRDGITTTTTDGEEQATPDAASTTVDPALDGDGSPTNGAAPGSDAEAEPSPDLAMTLAELPGGIDLVGGPLIQIGPFDVGAEQVARAYLGDRLPDVSVQLNEVDRDGPLTLFRWSVGGGDRDVAGSVIVRLGSPMPGVVLATTDGVEVVSVERTLDRVGAAVVDVIDDLLVADVTTIRGEVVPEAPNPDGLIAAPGGGGGRALGTAGSTSGERLEIDVTVGPIPVVVRVQHVSGTFLSISEFAIDPIGFPSPCGVEPPLTIDVGDQLGALQPGPAPRSTRGQLLDQGIWHYPGEPASIEIRWPADPNLVGLLDLTDLSGNAHFGSGLDVQPADNLGSGPAEDIDQHVLAVVDPSIVDPCSLVQFSFYGDPIAVDWWATAISGELSFDLPLTIAELDPAVGPDGSGPGDGEPDELVIATESTAPQAVHPTDSCDGLPGAPPRGGLGSGAAGATAADALADFLATDSTIDPPLPAGGYTEHVIDDTRSSFAILADGAESALVVVDVMATDEGWVVERWSAAGC